MTRQTFGFSHVAVAAFVALASPFVSRAWAYIPPSGFVVKTLASKHGGVKGVRVRGLVTAMENEQPTSARLKIVTVYQAESGTLRSVASDEANQKLYVFEKKLDALTEPLLLPIRAVGSLLMDSQPARLIETLRKHGLAVSQPIEPAPPLGKDEAEKAASAEKAQEKTPKKEEKEKEEITFSRWNRTVAWVLAKNPKEGGNPQLWIEKDTFLPLRVLDDSGRELTFENYKHIREFPYPRLISRVDDKKLVFKEEVSEVAVNPAKDLAELKTPVQTGFTEAGNAASSELKDLIRKYYEAVN